MEEHISNDERFLWFIEDLRKEGDYFHFDGWVGSEQFLVDSLIVGTNDTNVVFKDRIDVIVFYPKMKGTQHGFSIKIDKKDIHEKIFAKSGDSTYELGCLVDWVVYFSGFNDYKKDLIVVENFYRDPDLVRTYALNNLNFNHSDYHKGKRSDKRFILKDTKEKLEDIIGKEIINWNHYKYANGIFQYCTAEQQIVYHVDSQSMAAIVFLTPDAPLETGTCFYRAKYTGEYKFDDCSIDNELYYKSFTGPYNDNMNFYDSTLHEKVDEVANVYNRLVIWDAKKIHAATKYFGDSLENSRFFHLFFFDTK